MIAFLLGSLRRLKTQRAVAMDGRRYRIEPWNGESDNPCIAAVGTFALFGDGAFFWLLFFAPAKKSDSPFRAKRPSGVMTDENGLLPSHASGQRLDSRLRGNDGSEGHR